MDGHRVHPGPVTHLPRPAPLRAPRRRRTGPWVAVALAGLLAVGGFAALTGRAAHRKPPQNQVAIVLGDRLLSAPTVLQAIAGGQVEISGGFTEASARELAKELGAR
ncbi:hypothetical protein [Streptomyces sp. TRM64462]|uniref:SecDF P1 head subdomain-containing protein n=1 Tax=Streptomyces sp. TRM64462 TaxID=2741726 RepID=UPI001C2F17C8|nr:hypothetical protein [Streptomyces sp. TRM64462]